MPPVRTKRKRIFGGVRYRKEPEPEADMIPNHLSVLQGTNNYCTLCRVPVTAIFLVSGSRESVHLPSLDDQVVTYYFSKEIYGERVFWLGCLLSVARHLRKRTE